MAPYKEMSLKEALRAQQAQALIGACVRPGTPISVYENVVWKESDGDLKYEVGETATVTVAIADYRGVEKILPQKDEMVYVYGKGWELWLKTDEKGQASLKLDKGKGRTFYDVPAVLPSRLRWFNVI